MPEGGYLPHKRIPASRYAQSVTYTDAAMAVEGAPAGMMWERMESGDMKLVPLPDLAIAECTTSDTAPNPTMAAVPPPPPPSAPDSIYILHTVNRATDTLEGLCIKFGVTRTALSRLNNFTVFMLAPDVLKIPASNMARSASDNEEQKVAKKAMERQAMVVKLANQFLELSRQESSAYLASADWDYDAAFAEAEGDLNWETSRRGEKKHLKMTRISTEVDARIAFARDHENDQVKLSPGVQLKKTKSMPKDDAAPPHASPPIRPSKPAAIYTPRDFQILQQRLKTCRSKLSKTRSELANLSPATVTAASSNLRSDFCNTLNKVLQGSITAPADIYGETIYSERANAVPSDHFPKMSKDLYNSIGDADNKLYGGSAYHRALRELHLILSTCPTSAVLDEEIAIASGVDEVHDGPNFLRAAAVIAMEKAYGSFEPIVEDFATRLIYIMGRVGDIIEYTLRRDSKTENTPFTRANLENFKTIFAKFTLERAEACVEYCQSDLMALTKYITWDLQERGTAGLAESMGEKSSREGERIVEIFSVEIDKALKGGKQQQQQQTKEAKKKGAAVKESAAPDDIMSQYERATAKEKNKTKPLRKWGEKSTVAAKSAVAAVSERGVSVFGGRSVSTAGGGSVNDGPDGENVAITALRQVMFRSDSDKTSLVINALVEHLSGRWRDNFSRMVACKFNTFFLLSFMEDFEAYLRVEGDGGVGEDDIENIKTKLVMLESDLEEEIEALEREGRNRRKGGYNNGNND